MLDHGPTTMFKTAYDIKTPSRLTSCLGCFCQPWRKATSLRMDVHQEKVANTCFIPNDASTTKKPEHRMAQKRAKEEKPEQTPVEMMASTRKA